MKRFATAVVAILICAGLEPAARQAATPYKLGTFERQGRPFVGVVLRESVVIDFAAAHAAIRNPAVALAAPTDMKDLIARYDRACADASRRSCSWRPPAPSAARVGARAFRAEDPAAHHVSDDDDECGGELPRARHRDGAGARGIARADHAHGGRGAAEHDERARDLGAQAGRHALEPVHLPEGAGGHHRRTARRSAFRRAAPRSSGSASSGWSSAGTASRVPVDRAPDYIFGYTLENDISDRGGRGDTRYGSDWLVTKNHDTFAPMGPFITPKEFIKDVQQPGDHVLASTERCCRKAARTR